MKALKLDDIQIPRGEDRRTTKTDFKRRVYDRRTKTFNYERTIHLSDTNMFGSVYFASFFNLQGESREEFLQYFMGEDFPIFIEQKYGIVTVDAYCKYFAPLYLYDNIVVKIQVTKLKRTKFQVQFETVRHDNNQVAATGKQWIGFTTAAGKPIAIPEIVVKNLKPYVQD